MATSVSLACVLDSQPLLSVPVSLMVSPHLPFPSGQQAALPSQPSPLGYQGMGVAGPALRPSRQGLGGGMGTTGIHDEVAVVRSRAWVRQEQNSEMAVWGTGTGDREAPVVAEVGL